MDFTSLFKGLADLLSGNAKQGSFGTNLMDILGSDVTKNLIGGYSALSNIGMMNDMMDFNKQAYQKQDQRTQQLFDRDMERRDRLRNLDFTAGMA